VAEWFKAAVLKSLFGRADRCCLVSFCTVLLMIFCGASRFRAAQYHLVPRCSVAISVANFFIRAASGLANGSAGLVPPPVLKPKRRPFLRPLL
jgi:hypothetical protein